ncbi:class I SAM-dependent DNA methyltransferase [Paenibacillus marinisediminis]
MEAYGRFALVYDRLMADMPYEAWTAFAIAAWEHYGLQPRTVADLGCGTGSVALPLAERGFSVIGIDLSETMLSIAREKEMRSGRMRGAVQWVCQDMREWEAPELVDSVISFCDSINYLTEPEDVTAVIQRTYNQLQPGGLFLLDMHLERQFEQYAAEQPFTLDEGDIAYIWYSEYDEKRKQIEHQLTIFVEDEDSGRYDRIDETHTQRVYSPEWVVQELKAAGFRDVDLYGEFKLEQPDDTTGRLFIAARK